MRSRDLMFDVIQSVINVLEQDAPFFVFVIEIRQFDFIGHQLVTSGGE